MADTGETLAERRRRTLESVVNLANTGHTRARAALGELRDDLLLTDGSVDYLNHAERELREAMARLDGARFAVEALLAKQERSRG